MSSALKVLLRFFRLRRGVWENGEAELFPVSAVWRLSVFCSPSPGLPASPDCSGLVWIFFTLSGVALG